MKLTSSGRTHSAAMIRSPSFSRSSSSITTAIFPWRMSSRISSIVFSALINLTLRYFRFDHQPFEITRDHVDLDIRARARAKLAQRRHLAGMRNDVDIESARTDLIDGQT